MKRWIKRILTFAVCGGLLAAIVFAFLPQPVAVDVATVDRGPLQVYVEDDGKTRLKDRYTVSAPLAGKLRRISYDAGDFIPRGQSVAVIEPTDPALLDPRARTIAEARVKAAQAALERAAAEVEKQKAALDLAETFYARALDLQQRNAITKSEIDERLMQKKTRVEEYRVARSAEDIARFEVDLAQAAFLRTRPPAEGGPDPNARFEIPAPPLHNGSRGFHVLRVFEESETIVQPGTSLVELGDPGDLEIEIDVLSSDAVKIKPGDRVILERWGGDEPLEARVRLVEPSGFMKISALGVEEQRVNVIADFLSRDAIPQSLGDGYRVEAKIVIWERDDVLRVPTSALFRQGDGWGVFRVADGKAHLQTVTIGKRNGLLAEVLEGLADADTVVVHPSDKIADGVHVVIR